MYVHNVIILTFILESKLYELIIGLENLVYWMILMIGIVSSINFDNSRRCTIYDSIEKTYVSFLAHPVF